MAKLGSAQKIDLDYRYSNRVVYRSGSVSTGSLTAHNIDDLSVHLGVLAEAQAPWAVTDAEFAVHTADPDAHHSKLHDVLDPNVHSVTGSQYDVVGVTVTNTLGLIGSVTDGNIAPGKLLRTTGAGSVTVTNLTAATSVTTPLISATADLLIDPVGHVVFPDAQRIRSQTFDSAFPIAGWEIYPTAVAGQSGITIGVGVFDELRTRVFVADETRVDRGEEMIGKSYGFVNDDFTTPGAIGGAGIETWWDNSPAIAGAIFSDGDWLVLRIFEDASGFSISTIWAQVFSAASGAVGGYLLDTVNDRQRWRFVLRAGTTNFKIRKGNIAIDWGQSGQGIILSSVVDPSGAPYMKISIWTGANPYTPANRTTKLQIGNLNGITDATMSPSGYGLYAENAFLKGDLVTAGGDVRVYQNSGINIKEDAGAFWDTSKKAMRWWPNLDNMTGQPSLSILSSKITSGLPNNQNYSWIKAYPTGGSWAQLQLDALGQGGTNNATVYLAGGSLVAGFPSQILISADVLTFTGPASMQTVTVEQLRRSTASGAHDIGTAGSPFSNLYVDNLIATSVTTSGALGGQIWQYDTGDMFIRSNSAASRVLHVANPGTGTMHLDVEGSITLGGTVDGVDVATLNSSFASLQSSYTSHIANVNAHHNQSHVLATTSALGPDHTVSGLTAGMVIRAATATTARFAVLSHDDLTGITPDQHHAKVHVLATSAGLGADHTVSGLTTGHALRATSGSTASFAQMQHTDLGGVTADQHHAQVHDMLGNDHTHTGGSALDIFGLSAPGTLARLTPSSNPGVNGAILRSTSAGGLTVQNLTVNGSVDIVNGGDLTVGTNVFFVDVSSFNVGINRAPDPQFDLDVLGNFRAGGFIVGQHAIQLASAKMILHFDGPAPYATDYTGEPTGHFGQVGTETGGVVYRVGKFGKGVQICEGSTNQCPNPSFEINTTGWTEVNDTNNHATLTRVTTDYYVGGACLKLTCDTASTYAHTQRHFHGPNSGSAWNNGSSATISAWVKGNGTWRIAFEDSSNNLRGFTEFTLATTDDWQRFSVTATNITGSNFSSYKMVIFPMSSGATTLYVDGVQYEDKPYATAYFDGTFGDLKGYAWTNILSPHNSTSTRTAAAVAYNTAGVVNPARGTIMGWIKSSHAGASDLATIVDVAGTGINGLYIYLSTSGLLSAAFGTGLVLTTIASATPVVAEQWSHFALTWGTTGEGVNLYVNGGLVASSVSTPAISPPTTMTVGRFNTSAIRFFNGIIDDIIFTDRTESAAQIRAIYESNAPVFAESSVFQFRAGNGLVWGDNEGLWMRDTTGNNVLGVSGVSGKSWGGLLLDPGDFLLGSTTNGYLLYDASAQSVGITLADVTGPFLKMEPTHGISMRIGDGTTYDDKRAISWYEDPSVPVANAPVSFYPYKVGSLYALRTLINKPAGVNTYGFYSLTTDGTDTSANKAQSTLELWGSDNVNNSQVYLLTHKLYLGQTPGTVAGNRIEMTGNIYAYSKIMASTTAGISLMNNAGTHGVTINNGGNTSISNSLSVTGTLTANQNLSAGAAPPLTLTQNDVSEEFIEFSGVATTGGPIDTAAVGTYYGKVRVSVGGTFKYMALYNS